MNPREGARPDSGWCARRKPRQYPVIWRGIATKQTARSRDALAATDGCRGSQGFTLVELVIVLAVIAILAAIALPSYNTYIQRAHRGHAKAALLKAAHWMERVATAQGAYPTTLAAGLSAVEGNRYTVCLIGATDAPAGCPAATPPLLAASDAAFALAAYPRDPGGNASDKCGAFTVTHLSTRGLVVGGAVSNDANLMAECWNR